jgi:2-methylisocitrate lyase-like PEP mutase family enzyme
MSVLANQTPTSGPQRLRELLARSEPTLAPGAFDALSARVVESAGFDAVYMTGFGSTASLLGQPDVGLLTEHEMMENARRMAQAINVPLIADADTGYGNPLNVIRAVRDYERAGVAALHIEDQVGPKKCGHMDRIIARTDARAMEGLDAALDRAEAYRDAGADLLFIEAPQSVDEIEAVARRLKGTPLLFNWAEGGKTPPVGLADLSQMGFKLIIFPISLLLAATQAMQAAAAAIRTDGTPINLVPTLPSFQQFTDFIGLPEVKAVERRYGVEEW